MCAIKGVKRNGLIAIFRIALFENWHIILTHWSIYWVARPKNLNNSQPENVGNRKGKYYICILEPINKIHIDENANTGGGDGGGGQVWVVEKKTNKCTTLQELYKSNSIKHFQEEQCEFIQFTHHKFLSRIHVRLDILRRWFCYPFLLWLCKYASDLVYNFAICTALKCILTHTTHRNDRNRKKKHQK